MSEDDCEDYREPTPPKKRRRSPKTKRSEESLSHRRSPKTKRSDESVSSHPSQHVNQDRPTQSTPPQATLSMASVKALPTVADDMTDVLTDKQDEYIPREYDAAGERKISPTGEPLEGRQFKIRTFCVSGRGESQFMLATECARVLGYRDSYLLFNKNRSLYKIIVTQPEKGELIHQEILPYSYRSRQIAIVTARSIFRQFGARVIKDGRRVRDDYWESKAKKQGFTEEDLAGDKQPEASKLFTDPAVPGKQLPQASPYNPYHDYVQRNVNLHDSSSTDGPKSPNWQGDGTMPALKSKSLYHPFSAVGAAEFEPGKKMKFEQRRESFEPWPDKDAIKNEAKDRILQHTSEATLYKYSKTNSAVNMNLIKTRLFQMLEFSPVHESNHKISLKMNWDLVNFLKNQYPDYDKVDLGSVIVINGSVFCAQATTCSEYVRNTWPCNGPKLIRLLQQALGNEGHQARASIECSTKIFVAEHDYQYQNASAEVDVSIDLSPTKNCLLIVQSHNATILVEILQQAIWMAAALRVSANERVQYSNFTISKKGIAEVSVRFETYDLTDTEQSCCWVPLFANPVITPGFLVPYRDNDEQGLEISLEMMAALGGARHLTVYGGGLVLKGYSTLFVPLRSRQDSIQWHFIQGDNGDHVSYRELEKRVPDRALLASVDYPSLWNKRMFLGWWISAQTHLGTAKANYDSIDWSSAGEAPRLTRFSGAEIGFQTMITGKMTFSMGAKDGKFHFARKGPFQKIVLCAEKTPIILYDVGDRRAWFVPALDVILHIVKTRHHLSFYNLRDQDVRIDAVDPFDNDGSAPRNAALANERRPLYEESQFRDEFLDIWSQIERLQEKDDVVGASSGIALHGTMRSKVQGWEYMCLVHEKNYRRKEVVIQKSSGGWADLVADIDSLVLFGKGFDEVIRPSHDTSKLCRKWRSLPKDKDFLAARVSVVELLYSEAGSKDSRKHLSTSHLQWHRGSSLFEQCTDTSSDWCGCDRTQQIYHDSMFKTLGHVNPPGELEKNGCVLFGQLQHALKPTKKATSRENPIYNLPNIPLRSLESSSLSTVKEQLTQRSSQGTPINEHSIKDNSDKLMSPKRPLSQPELNNIRPDKSCKLLNGESSISSEQSPSMTAIESSDGDDDVMYHDETERTKSREDTVSFMGSSNGRKLSVSEHAPNIFGEGCTPTGIKKTIRRMPNFETRQHRDSCPCTLCVVADCGPRDFESAEVESSTPSTSET